MKREVGALLDHTEIAVTEMICDSKIVDLGFMMYLQSRAPSNYSDMVYGRELLELRANLYLYRR